MKNRLSRRLYISLDYFTNIFSEIIIEKESDLWFVN